MLEDGRRGVAFSRLVGEHEAGATEHQPRTYTSRTDISYACMVHMHHTPTPSRNSETAYGRFYSVVRQRSRNALLLCKVVREHEGLMMRPLNAEELCHSF